MAKRIEDIVTIPAQIIPFPLPAEIVACGCGRDNCGAINLAEHAYLYSNVTGKYYSDGECLTHDVEEDIDFLDTMQRVRLYTKWEVENVG